MVWLSGTFEIQLHGLALSVGEQWCVCNESIGNPAMPQIGTGVPSGRNVYPSIPENSCGFAAGACTEVDQAKPR